MHVGNAVCLQRARGAFAHRQPRAALRLGQPQQGSGRSNRGRAGEHHAIAVQRALQLAHHGRAVQALQPPR
ncbi:hypothetical protein G6F62_012814 [Rhizopus arrhizus]|nr:hypothetical protein G6F62_012814 [Rhizopus arrhizus]